MDTGMDSPLGFPVAVAWVGIVCVWILEKRRQAGYRDFGWRRDEEPAPSELRYHGPDDVL